VSRRVIVLAPVFPRFAPVADEGRSSFIQSQPTQRRDDSQPDPTTTSLQTPAVEANWEARLRALGPYPCVRSRLQQDACRQRCGRAQLAAPSEEEESTSASFGLGHGRDPCVHVLCASNQTTHPFDLIETQQSQVTIRSISGYTHNHRHRSIDQSVNQSVREPDSPKQSQIPKEGKSLALITSIMVRPAASLLLLAALAAPACAFVPRAAGPAASRA
jgi:hypothetical protein